MKYKVIFMGTPEFAAGVLSKLIENQTNLYEVVAVVSQPDKKIGRKRILTPTPVKVIADSFNIPVLQPERIGDAYDALKAFAPDVIITAAYGQIVPEKILNLPKLKCINVHASLLPKYRGGAPIHRAIINGEKETGVTIMYMEKGLDTGDMLATVVVPIMDDDTLESMFKKLEEMGAQLLIDMLPAFFRGEIVPEMQDEAQASYASNISIAETKIRWESSAREIYNKVRGLYPAPATFSTMQGTKIKIFAVQYDEQVVADQPGTIIESTKKGCKVATGHGSISLIDIQVSGKKRQPIAEVMNGVGKNLLAAGERFD